MITEQSNLKDILTLKYIMGYRGDFRNNIFQHSDTSKIIYPAGHNIVTYSTENKSQSFIYGNPGTKSITAMTMSASRRFLAWCEQAETGILFVYDMDTKKKKVFSSIESGSTYYTSLCFSRDEKILLTLTGLPEFNLVLWDWNKMKSTGFVKVQNCIRLNHCFFHPKEDEIIAVLGLNCFKLYKVSQEQIKNRDSPWTKKESKEIENPNFISYCYLKEDNTLIVGTDQGKLLPFYNNAFEFKAALNCSPDDGLPLESMCPFKNGFLAGSANCTVYVFEKQEGELRQPYRLNRKFQNKDLKSRVISLLLISQEEYLVVGLENGQLLQTAFNVDRGLVDETLKFEKVVQFFHSSKITGLSTCVRKPLVATCGADKSVRIWNYTDHTVDSICKEFEEEALTCAFHPSGLHLVVAFTDKIRILNIYEEELVTIKEIAIKNCKEISFSNGGHLIALSNLAMIQVYQFYTGENPPNYIFKGHAGTITSIWWQEDDLGFYSASNDGVVNEFRLENNANKNQLFSSNNLVPNCIIASSNKDDPKSHKEIFIAGNFINNPPNEEKCIYEVHFSSVETKDRENLGQEIIRKVTIDDTVPIFVECNLSQIQLSNANRFYFMATGEDDLPGAIRVSPFPFTGEVVELQIHAKPITKMKITFDDNYIFSVGEDGILAIYELKDKDMKLKREKEGGAIEMAEEFLIPKSKYLKKIKKIEKLKQEIADIDMKNNIKNRMQMKEKDEKIRQLDDKTQKLVEFENERYEKFKEERRKMDAGYEENKLQLRTQHEAMKKNKEAEYKQKIDLEEKRFEDLEKEKERERLAFEKFQKEFYDKFEREVKEMNDKYQIFLEEARQTGKRLNEEKKVLVENFEKNRIKKEEEAEKKITDLKEEAEKEIKKISNLHDITKEIKATKDKKFTEETQTLEGCKQNTKNVLDEIHNIQENNKQLQKDIEARDKEIAEKKKTIDEKKNRIYELQRKIQELEKFKFVLDYKIKELKREIGPREEEIAKMKEQISNMNAEILHFQRTNENLSLMVTDLNLKQKGMNNEIKNLEVEINKNEAYISSFKSGVRRCYGGIKNFKTLKAELLELYNKYVMNEKKKFEANVDVQQDSINKRTHLETTVKGLKKKFEKNMSTHKQDNARIMNENVDLLREINDLKREKTNLQERMLIKENSKGNEKKDKNKMTKIEKLQTEIKENQELLGSLNSRFEDLKKEAFNVKQNRPPSGKVKLAPLLDKDSIENK